MAIKIGHASYGEDGIRNQVAGDASGREVCITTWFNKNWDCVLRPKSATLAEKSAKAMEAACANNNVGYDQSGRNTLYTQAKANGFDLSKIKVKCECDCSSLVHVCAIAGGANLIYGSNGHTTRTMVNAFVASGDYEELKDKNYLTSDKYLKRGDILVKAGSHTIMILENGSSATSGSGSNTSIVAGKKVSLKNTPVYSSEYGATIGKRTGTYYLWDNVVKNGRIRVTNRPDRVGKAGQVSFFIDVSNI